MDFLTGYSAFHWVATWANPGFDVFFRIITDLGSHALYYLVCAPLFWVVDRRQASLLFLLVLISAYLNTVVKLGFATPRPDPALARVMDLRPFEAKNPSFPSGHTQGAVVFWAFLAVWVARRWMSAVAFVMVSLVAFSRVYLGAHFPIDIVGGVILGIGTLVVVAPLLRSWVERDLIANPTIVGPLLVSALAATLLTNDPSLAMLSGCLLGFVVATVWLPQPPPLGGNTRQRTLAALVGVLIMAPCAAAIETAHGNALLLLAAVTFLWIVALWVYPHALSRFLAAQEQNEVEIETYP